MNSTENLDDQLRRVLRMDADHAPVHDLTPEAFHARVDRNDARTTPPRVGRRTRVTAVAAVAVAAAAGVTVFGPQGSAAAFASWASKPAAISAADAARLDAACRTGAGVTPGPIYGGYGPGQSAGTRVIIDRRGHSAYSVYTNGKTWSSCLTTIPGMSKDKGMEQTILEVAQLNQSATATETSGYPLRVASAAVPEGNHVPGQAAPVMFVSGRVAATVASVSVATSKGQVTASIRDGYFAAWWPGNDSDTAVVRAYDAKGHQVGSVDGLNCTNAKNQFAPRTQVPGIPSTGGCLGPY